MRRSDPISNGTPITVAILDGPPLTLCANRGCCGQTGRRCVVAWIAAGGAEYAPPFPGTAGDVCLMDTDWERAY